MAFEPKKITRENVLAAVERIIQENIKLQHSTRWNVIIDGKPYPPKEIMRYAHKEMNGEKLWEYSGGESTNKWLENLGFQVVEKMKGNDPVLKIIEQYKKAIQASSDPHDELYKWQLFKRFQGRPDTDAPDFTAEMSSIDFKNLVYPLAIGVIQHLAKERPEELRNEFIHLFDENIHLMDRIRSFSDKTLAIYRDIDPENMHSHHQDERTIATYLTYHDPDRYTLYKDSFYQKYCRLIGEKPKRKGDKYLHYLSLIDEFIDDYVLEDDELITMAQNFLTEDCFSDNAHKLLAQDILYTTLDRQIGLSRNYWRIGTSADDENYWEVMKQNRYVSIGWPNIGDLSVGNIQTKEAIGQLLMEKGYYQPTNKNMASRKAGEIFSFLQEIREGDIVVVQNGRNVLGIGEVVGEYIYEGSETFPHYRPVEWKILEPDFKNEEGLQTTVWRIKQPDIIQKINDLLQSNQHNKTMDKPLNIILFGPPGTGKTYNTVNRALEICGIDIKNLDRLEVKSLFEQKVKDGRIVFTTFHQSMTYEDFVEGIKPMEPVKEGDPVVYRIEEGIFRRLCIEAAFSLAKQRESETTERVLDFSEAFDRFVQEMEDRLSSEEPVFLKTKNGGKVLVEGISQQGSILIKHPGKDNIYPVTKQRLSRLHTAFSDLSKVHNIDQQFREVIGGSNSTVNWAVLSAIREMLPDPLHQNKLERIYTWEEKKDVVERLTQEDYKDKNGEPFVLIIDEINRGNVSQIFGELITLVEEDKRLGNAESIQVMLPYSKESFGVPPNVHILGTMNTADRSVEALDTALRRRFCFVEMPPKYDLIKTESEMSRGIVQGIDLALLLKTINQRIEKLLDKDHMIGHSYFLKIGSIEALKDAFHHKIIPLLQEYFYGDYGKIGLILGEDFFEIDEWQSEEDFFAPFDNYDSSAFLERSVFHIRNCKQMSEEEFVSAIKALMRIG